VKANHAKDVRRTQMNRKISSLDAVFELGLKQEAKLFQRDAF